MPKYIIFYIIFKAKICSDWMGFYFDLFPGDVYFNSVSKYISLYSIQYSERKICDDWKGLYFDFLSSGKPYIKSVPKFISLYSMQY